MGIFDWRRKPATIIDIKSAPSTVPNSFGLDWMLTPNTSSGISVTAQTAMQCAPYAACHRVFVDAIATLPVKLLRRLPDGGKEAATDDPRYDLIHDSANEWTSSGTLRASLIADAMSYGNGVAIVTRDSSGMPVELHRIDPAAVTIERDRYTSEPIYRVRLSDGGETVFSHGDVLHIVSPFRAGDGISGIGFPTIAREAIALSLVLQSSAATIFANSASPSGVISSPKILGDEVASRLRASWMAAFGGVNRGRPVVLEESMTYAAIQAQPLTDAQFLEMRGYQLNEIARVFGVPASMIGDMSRATWSNSTENNRYFLQHALLPWIVQFEDAFSRALLTAPERKQYAISFVTDGFVRASLQERAAAYASFRASGVYTSNELRALEDLPAHADGDSIASPHTVSNDAPDSTPAEDTSDAE